MGDIDPLEVDDDKYGKHAAKSRKVRKPYVKSKRGGGWDFSAESAPAGQKGGGFNPWIV